MTIAKGRRTEIGVRLSRQLPRLAPAARRKGHPLALVHGVGAGRHRKSSGGREIRTGDAASLRIAPVRPTRSSRRKEVCMTSEGCDRCGDFSASRRWASRRLSSPCGRAQGKPANRSATGSPTSHGLFDGFCRRKIARKIPQKTCCRRSRPCYAPRSLSPARRRDSMTAGREPKPPRAGNDGPPLQALLTWKFWFYASQDI